ncbi:MAG TPA: hypothetical protein VFG54_20150, partial [Prolixibacteraceae bacterium]|nr:hypothetical protein [Prolixibacteraceae bacterium]
MNKSLFEIRKIHPRWIWIVLIIIAAVLISLGSNFITNNKGFLKFHSKEHYKPLNEISEDRGGFYGKVNFYLEKALKDTVTNQGYSVGSINSFYQRLKFYSPVEENPDYLVDTREIRLVGFIPDSTNLEEMKFFHNSNFKRLLERQSQNVSGQFFKIEWKNGITPRIKSIVIDNTLGDVALLNDKWTGQIVLDDPFSQIDSTVVYLIKNNIPIPLFTSNLPLRRLRASESFANETTTILNKEWSHKKTEIFGQIYQLLNRGDDSNLFRVKYSNDQYLDFLNTGDSIFFSNSLVDINFWVDGREQEITEHCNTHSFPTSFRNVVKLKITNTEGHPPVNEIIYISKMPFRIASKLTNEGFAGKRTHVNEEYCDLFTRQEIMHLESNLKTESQQTIALTNNILQSKVLEDEMRAYVNDTLYGNPLYRWNEKDEFQMSFCLMDISTGEVIAAPYYSNRFMKNKLNEKDEMAEIKNFNLEFHHIGSAFKPMLAFAASAKYPALQQFNLTSAQFSEDSCKLLGYTVTPYGKKKDNKQNTLFWSNNINRTFFLGHSHDNYPIALAMLALTENAPEDANAYTLLNSQDNWNNGSVNNLYQLLGNAGTRLKYYPRKSITEKMLFRDENVDAKLGESSFANLISNLFDVEMEMRDRENAILSADTISWRHLIGNSFQLYTLYPDKVNLHLDLILNFRDFENFILGQGNNKWSNIKLAEAYSRLLSKRKIQSTFLKSNEQFGYLFDNPSGLFKKISSFEFQRTEQEMESTWNLFMNDWRNAVLEGGQGNTLTPAYNEFLMS